MVSQNFWLIQPTYVMMSGFSRYLIDTTYICEINENNIVMMECNTLVVLNLALLIQSLFSQVYYVYFLVTLLMSWIIIIIFLIKGILKSLVWFYVIVSSWMKYLFLCQNRVKEKMQGFLMAFIQVDNVPLIYV